MIYPKKENIINFHTFAINNWGGTEGWINPNLLDSALYTITYYKTLYEAACSIFFYLAKDHIWKDGNKRTACMTFLTMLKENKCKLNCSNLQLKEFAEYISDKEGSKKEWVFEFFKDKFIYIEPRYIYAIIYNKDKIDISDSKQDILQIKNVLQKENINYIITKSEEQNWIKSKETEDINWWKRQTKVQRLRL